MWWSNRTKNSLYRCVLYVCMIVAFSSLKHKQTKLIYKLMLLLHEGKATYTFHVTLTDRLGGCLEVFRIYFTARVFEHVNACSFYLIPVAHSANRYEAIAIVDTTWAMPA